MSDGLDLQDNNLLLDWAAPEFQEHESLGHPALFEKPVASCSTFAVEMGESLTKLARVLSRATVPSPTKNEISKDRLLNASASGRASGAP